MELLIKTFGCCLLLPFSSWLLSIPFLTLDCLRFECLEDGTTTCMRSVVCEGCFCWCVGGVLRIGWVKSNGTGKKIWLTRLGLILWFLAHCSKRHFLKSSIVNLFFCLFLCGHSSQNGRGPRVNKKLGGWGGSLLSWN